jgi:DNA-binding IscR family transcriptional regulator
MTISLKSFVPVLARYLHLTPDMLYERQRALVRAGLLESAPGRGPGSGTRATPETVALLLIAVLAEVSLGDVGPLSDEVAKAAPVSTKKCPLTGATTFKDALARILADKDLLDKVDSIRVAGMDATAEIIFRENRQKRTSKFAGRPSEEGGIRPTITVGLTPGFHKIVAGLFEASK